MACRWVRSWKLLLSWTRMTTWCCHSPSAQGLLVLRPPQISISRPSGASMLARSCRPRLWPFPATAQVLSLFFSIGHIVHCRAVLVFHSDVVLLSDSTGVINSVQHRSYSLLEGSSCVATRCAPNDWRDACHGLDAAKYSNCCISPRQASALPHHVLMNFIIYSHGRISRGSRSQL